MFSRLKTIINILLLVSTVECAIAIWQKKRASRTPVRPIHGSEFGAEPTQTELVAYLEALAERGREVLAQRLHDDIGGLLVSALMDLACEEQPGSASTLSGAQKLTRARQSLANAVDMERQMIEELRPTLLDNVGLLAALRWHVLATCKLAKIECDIDLPKQEPQLLAHAPILLFRFVEEALASLLMDESVTSANLTVTANGQVLTVCLMSDGSTSAARGVDGNTPYSLLRLKHRAAALGGDVRFVAPSAGNTGIVARFSFEEDLRDVG